MEASLFWVMENIRYLSNAYGCYPVADRFCGRCLINPPCFGLDARFSFPPVDRFSKAIVEADAE